MFSNSCDRYGLKAPPLAAETVAELKASLPVVAVPMRSLYCDDRGSR
ncbi:MAG: hypothetical protein HYY78_20915 [Betaproteobacteria bacterium]|nr:hypothetical protein [Betaproteobacteria bacterium]